MRMHIDIATQTLTLIEADGITRRYPVSTARNGPGNLANSGCTPLGLHRVRLKIGSNAPSGTVFIARRPTNEIFDANAAAQEPNRDWMLSRILWLQGLEPGVNRGGAVDTLRRYVYIHGTADEHAIGTACSHGCIRMTNADVIDLFERVKTGTLVHIESQLDANSR